MLGQITMWETAAVLCRTLNAQPLRRAVRRLYRGKHAPSNAGPSNGSCIQSVQSRALGMTRIYVCYLQCAQWNSNLVRRFEQNLPDSWEAWV